MVARRTRVPRALLTRGTPDGYYEIPVTVYRRVNWNMSSGLWETNQATGAQIGSSGYQGFGMGTQLDTSQFLLGNGSVSASIQITVPGFAELQNVFDECKIARIDYEIWLSNQANFQNSTAYQTPNIWVVTDYNGIDPPSSLNSLLQYADVRCIKGDIRYPDKFSVYPKIREDASSDGGELSTAATSSVNVNSTYMSTAKPSALHYGVRGLFEINTTQPVAQGYMHIVETQWRRYKRVK